MHLGIDAGSSTVKVVLFSPEKKLLFTCYQKHHGKVRQVLLDSLRRIDEKWRDMPLTVGMTGTTAGRTAACLELPFMQEVKALSSWVKRKHPDAGGIVEIGGEDAKFVLLEKEKNPIMKMNGNCAGGTGSFIEQMAQLLDVSLEKLDALAQKNSRTLPIASRCGVFAKTDIQSLLNQGYPREDVAWSIFQAAANQYTTSLMSGLEPKGVLIMGGGPLTHFQSLRDALAGILPNTLKMADNSLYLPAMGTAIDEKETGQFPGINTLIEKLESLSLTREMRTSEKPLFRSEKEYRQFQERQGKYTLPYAEKVRSDEPLFMGIDAGSTTMKFVIMNAQREIVASYYTANEGDSLEALRKGLQKHQQYLPRVQATYSTGYGRDICREAFNLSGTFVETAAHYLAGCEFHDDIDFVLDIGGQDIKAMKVEDDIITDFYLNEACSSGTGSFLENFASDMNLTMDAFIREALFASNPPSLGSRCTVFMNSKVKDALNEGLSVGEIAAGLAYSVVKNALYKVIRVRHIKELGDTILVQGGTFKNDAVLRAFEILTGSEVIRIEQAHLMGAYGAALHALQQKEEEQKDTREWEYVSLDKSPIEEKKNFQCGGCGNNCQITRFIFQNKREYMAGNKCDRPLKKEEKKKPVEKDFFDYKYDVCYRSLIEEDTPSSKEKNRIRIGIPLVLSHFEHFPFFYTLFKECQFDVEVSHWTTDDMYKQGIQTQLSDNLCFPAKIVHGHVEELIQKRVDRVFMPMIGFEKKEDERANNAYNCPIVTGYSEVIASIYNKRVPIDKPLISFVSKRNLYKTTWSYMKSLGIKKSRFNNAFMRALERTRQTRERYIEKGKQLVEYARSENLPLIVVAGKVYHIDPIIHHGILPMISQYDVVVINEEVGAALAGDVLDKDDVITQWTYHNRVSKSAVWLKEEEYSPAGFIQLTSFGCGPDAVTTDIVSGILKGSTVPYISIKLDEMSTLGPASIRVESLLYALHYQQPSKKTRARQTFSTTQDLEKKQTILIPHLADIYTEVLESVFESFGYKTIIPSRQSAENVEKALHCVNNDMCYPAMIVVGDILATLEEKKVNPENNDIVVGLPRTGGPCRVTNYATVMRRALHKNGYHSIPVVTLSTTGSLEALPVNRYQLLKKASMGFLLADVIQSMVLSTRPYEKKPGSTEALLRDVKKRLKGFIADRPNRKTMKTFLSRVVEDFNALPVYEHRNTPVGIVGEIYLKMNSFSNNYLARWLEKNGYEAVIPGFHHFLEVDFHSQLFNWQKSLRKDLSKVVQSVMKKAFFDFYRKEIIPVMRAYKRPQPDFEIAEGLKDNIVSRGIQFGEAWLLPLEIMMLYRKGVRHVVSVQPFGCISNHVISKGLQKKIRENFPGLQFMTLDYESGNTNVHIANRLSLFFQ